MSAPPNKPPTSALGANKEEVPQQSQPIDLAKPNPNVSTGSGVTALPTRFVGEAPAGILLVRPTSGSPAPVITLPNPPVSHTQAAGSVVQQGPVTVTVPMPLTMARFQATVRPGTVTLAPRVVPTIATSTSGAYSGQPSHVPKGAAAVASIAIPRSAVATAAVIRPVPSVSPAISQVTGFAIGNRAAKPTSVSVRPGLEGTNSAGAISGTWVTVTPAVTAATPTQAPPVPTLYKAGAEAASAGVKSTTTTNLILTSQVPNKPAPALTPSPNAASLSIVGQPKVSAVPAPTSSVTLLSVRGSNPTNAPRPLINPTGAITVGLRPGSEVIKTAPTLVPSATQQQQPPLPPQRTSSVTITSTSSVQGAEKQFVKTVSGVLPSSGSPAVAGNQARNSPSGPVQIAARTISSAVASPLTSNTVITSNSGLAPVVITGALKNITPISNVVGKVGQPGIAVQFPQMPVSAVTSSKMSGTQHTPVVAGIRQVATSGPVPVGAVGGGGNVSVGGARTYLVTTTQASTNVIPVAKVLPQQIATTSGGNQVVATSAIRADTSATAIASSGEVHQPVANPGQHYLPRSNPASSESTSTSGANPAAPAVPPAAAQPLAQPSTPSKLLGSSPRPSILRKRDYEGVPLKAQKNLSATLTGVVSVTSTPSATTVPSLPTTPIISPPSPRRVELGSQTPGGPNGDSSRSSSGGSTTLSASSSPGIPPDMEDSPANITTPAAVLGKALSNIQVKQEAAENAETTGAIASLMRMSSTNRQPPQPAEVQMSPRKKPRKQQLLGQELQEVRSSDDEMPPTYHVKEIKQEPSVKCEPKEVATVVKRPRVSLISSYRQTWKARNHHFTRYSDVKLKDERRPTVTDLANQKHVMQKVHGWKVFHLSAQIEEMAQSEAQIHERLSVVLEVMENLGSGKNADRDLMRVNELIKGNLQRSKVIQDGLEDSKIQVQKIFDHKPRAEDIIQRYMYKRLAKKREKM